MDKGLTYDLCSQSTPFQKKELLALLRHPAVSSFKLYQQAHALSPELLSRWDANERNLLPLLAASEFPLAEIEQTISASLTQFRKAYFKGKPYTHILVEILEPFIAFTSLLEEGKNSIVLFPNNSVQSTFKLLLNAIQKELQTLPLPLLYALPLEMQVSLSSTVDIKKELEQSPISPSHLVQLEALCFALLRKLISIQGTIQKDISQPNFLKPYSNLGLLVNATKLLVEHTQESTHLEELLKQDTPLLEDYTFAFVSPVENSLQVKKGEAFSTTAKDQVWTSDKSLLVDGKQLSASKRYSFASHQLQDDQNGLKEHKENKEAIGFEIRSSLFGLRSKQKSIKLSMICKKSSAFLLALKKHFGVASNKEALDAFHATYTHGIQLAYFSTSGLHQVNPKMVESKLEFDKKGRLRLQIGVFLGFEDPLPLETKDCVFQFTTDQLHFGLAALLSQMQIETVHLNVKATALSDFNLYTNTNSQEALGFPCEPFGNSPEIGDAFYLEHPIVFANKIEDLKLNFQWGNLPKDFLGFESYYAGYGLTLNNSDFKVALSGKERGAWKPEENRQVISLFKNASENEEDGHFLSPISRFNEINWRNVQGDSFIKYNAEKNLNHTAQGFIKFELVAPSFAFGHQLFNARLHEFHQLPPKTKLKTPQPNVPYTPMLKGLTADVELSENIKLDDAAFSPIWGDLAAEDRLPSERNSLFYPFHSGASLVLHFEGEDNNGQLNLFVDLQDLMNDSAFHYSFLIFDKNTHESIDSSAFLLDETNGFTTTGRLELALPESFKGRSNFSLLIYSTQRNAFQHIQGIQQNAVRLSNSFQQDEWLPLEHQSLASKRTVLDQPFGRLRFTTAPDHLSSNYLERGLHGKLMRSSWDLKQLLLAAFPQIQFCEIATEAHLKRTLVIYVLPHFPKWKAFTYSGEPGVFHFDPETLQSIKSFVAQQVHQGIAIQVSNFTFRKVQLHGTVSKQKDELNQNIISALTENAQRQIAGWLFDEFTHKPEHLSSISILPQLEDCNPNIRLNKLIIQQEGTSLLQNEQGTLYQLNAQVGELWIPAREHMFTITNNEHTGSTHIDSSISNAAIGSDLLIGKQNMAVKVGETPIPQKKESSSILIETDE